MKVIICMMLLLPTFSYALDMNEVKISAVVESPINNLGVATGFTNQQQVDLDDYSKINLDSFDCYAIIPIGRESDNPKFFEKTGDDYRLKPGTTLNSVGVNISGPKNATYTGFGDGTVKGTQIDFYLQIKGRRFQWDEKKESVYDLVLSCPAEASTSLTRLLKDDWDVDLDGTIQRANQYLNSIIKLTNKTWNK